MKDGVFGVNLDIDVVVGQVDFKGFGSHHLCLRGIYSRRLPADLIENFRPAARAG